MFFKSISKALLIIFSVALASNVAYKFYNKKRKKTRSEIYEVIMFSSNVTSLKQSKYSRFQISYSMDRLLHYLNSPRVSIDICMYVITNTDISNVIIKLHFRGVKVRVIMDADMAFTNRSIIKRFDKHKIQVRWMKSTYLMHHKFCLIDTLKDAEKKCTPIVILGSLNWTTQALSGNWEDVVVTTQEDFVRQYKIEFERLWLQFKPIGDLT